MAYTSRATLLQAIAAGKGFTLTPFLTGSGNGTTAAAASGWVNPTIFANLVGTTFPGTIVGIPLPPGTSALRPTVALMNTSIGRLYYLARFYKLGTLDLTATGDKFTHDTATYPLLTTRFGAASQPTPMYPVLHVTTALTTTAAVLTLKTAGGAAGYTNQDGTNVVGTRTFTFPSATTATGSCYFLRLEDGDSAVRDISAIQVNTASATGACNVWGVVPRVAIAAAVANTYGYAADVLFGGLAPTGLLAGTATTGTATSFLALMGIGNPNTATAPWLSVMGVSDA